MIFDIDYDLVKGKKVPGIYKITNLKNGKIYIGQSKHLRHRISDYINIHERDGMTHPIADEIKKVGTDNFKFEIIKFCSEEELPAMELYYIKLFKSYDQNYGYNKILHTAGISAATSKNMSESHTGLKESPTTKRKKSNVVFIFNEDHSSLYISDSAKLFGIFIGKDKDTIKNAIRQPSRVFGYSIYYADYIKREEIYFKLVNKRCVRNIQFISDISLLNNLMKEGVETIYRQFNVFRLSYDNLDEAGRPILIQVSNGYDYNNAKSEFVLNKDIADDTANLLSGVLSVNKVDIRTHD